MVSPFLSLLYAYFISDSQLKNANLYTTVCPYKNRKSEGSNTQFQSLIHPKTRRKGKHALACEVIGCGSAGKLHGHHVNYRRPRDVIFACPRHHEAIHRDGPQPLKANVRTQRKYARPPGLSTPQ
jgi:hypothetical protein